MSYFEPIIVLYNITEEEYEELKKEFNDRITVKARWSYNFEIIPAKDFDDVFRMNRDTEYGLKCLEEANQRL